MMPKLERKDWFKLYPRDFFASMKWQVQTPTERGIYCTLLFQAWCEWPHCSLPTDLKVLRRLVNCLSKHDHQALERVLSTCFHLENDRYVNDRLLSQRDEVIDLSAVKSNSASSKKEHVPSICIADVLQITDIERRGEGEADVEADVEASSATRDVGTKGGKADSDAAWKKAREMWQDRKGRAAICKKPLGKIHSWWKEACEGTDWDLLEKALAWWMDNHGSKFQTDEPLYHFLTFPYGNAVKEIEAENKLTPEQTEAEKQSEAAAIEAWRLDHIEPKTTEELLAEQNKDADAPDDFMRMLREQV